MELLSAAARRLNLHLQGADARYLRVVTDTRAIQPGDLFVALKGERFDAHDFVAEAAGKGAIGALVSRAVDAPIAQLLVTDTLLALQRLAASWRAGFDLPVIGVTGSNGKTTTKQLLAAVFAARGPVLATEGNLNNHIGVPLTLLKLRQEHRTAVVEMGASNAGEIALLARLAQPTVGIITQAGDAHLEGFGSREGVARAKGELFAALGRQSKDQGAAPKGGTAIINADDAYAGLWKKLAGDNRIVSFGFAAHAEVRAEDLLSTPDGNRFKLLTPDGSAMVSLPLPGRHNIANALAAAAAGHALGLCVDTIAEGLQKVERPKGRVVIHTLANGARLIDDSYNANPTSLAAAMALLAKEPGQRLLVLGDMAELGPTADALHARAGIEAKALGLNALLTLGPRSAEAAKSFGIGGKAFDSPEALIEALRPQLKGAATVLVKGSRSARMERVVAALLEQNMTEATH
ncbi:MAG: UDP-N-acetylmuramoyl-tripeptide--D-alanyl-D-alanine ligase [Pseudomonadota bacterium]